MGGSRFRPLLKHDPGDGKYPSPGFGIAGAEPAMTTSEQQAVPGEMKDLSAPPPEEPATQPS